MTSYGVVMPPGTAMDLVDPEGNVIAVVENNRSAPVNVFVPEHQIARRKAEGDE